MAVHSNGLKAKQVVKFVKDTNGGNVGSGFVDMALARRLLLIGVAGDRATAGRVYIKVGHASASSTLYASATAITTLSGTSLSTAHQNLINVCWDGYKRYAVVLASTTATSATNGVLALSTDGEAVPPASTGFTVVKQIPNNP